MGGCITEHSRRKRRLTRAARNETKAVFKPLPRVSLQMKFHYPVWRGLLDRGEGLTAKLSKWEALGNGRIIEMCRHVICASTVKTIDAMNL